MKCLGKNRVMDDQGVKRGTSGQRSVRVNDSQFPSFKDFCDNDVSPAAASFITATNRNNNNKNNKTNTITHTNNHPPHYRHHYKLNLPH